MASYGHEEWKVIILPDDGIREVLAFIRSAKASILCKYFKMVDQELIDEFVAAHERGVSVRIMLNPVRSDGSRVNDEALATLRQAGVAAEWTNPKFAVSHEKSIIVDNLRVLIATFNMCPSCLRSVRDYGLITDDPAIVLEVRRCFEADWSRQDFQPDHLSPLLWSTNNSRVKMADFLDHAKKTLDVQHPKLVDAVILDRLLDAHERGVRVRFLCGGSVGISDWDIVECFSAWRILRRAGIKVHVQKTPKLHAKLIIADDKRALLSSLNIDRSAFDLRRELGVVTDSPQVVDRLRQRFRLDWITAAKYRVQDPLVAARKKPSSRFDEFFQHE